MLTRSGTRLAVALAATFLIGCGDGGTGGGGKAGGGDGGEKTRYGALAGKVRGLDPMDIGDTYSGAIGANFYETLYDYHYLKRPYEVVPQLADGMPQYSDDQLTVTIKIKPGVYFHDNECFPNGKGRELKAADFVYSWKRLADLKNRSKNWWLIDGRIVGLNEFREYTKGVANKADVDYDREVEGLTAVDDYTLQIKLAEPVPDLLFRLAHTPLSVVAREAVDHYGDRIQNHAVGTGAYVLEKWERGSRIVMARNPNFREELYPSEGAPGDKEKGLLDDAGKPLPLCDKAIIYIIEEDQPYWLQFMSGKLDLAGIPKDAFNKAINENRDLTPEMKKKNISLIKFEDPGTFWLGFNMEDKVLGKNLPLRQAMNLALDREEYVEDFTNRRGIPARSILPPMMKEYNPDLNSPFTTYNEAMAKQKVAEAKALHQQMYNEPLPPITIDLGGTDTTYRQMGQYYQRAFEKVGLTVEIEYMDWPSVQEKIKTKSSQVFQMGWLADWPDAENFMLLFYGPNESPGANNMNYKNAEVDKLYEQIKTMEPSDERTEILRRIEQMVIDDLPCIPQFHRVAYVLQHPWHLNYKPHVFGYGLTKYYNIDLAARRKAVDR